MLKSAIIHKLVNEIVYVRHQAGLTVTALGEARQDTQTYLLRLAEAKNWALFWETAANGKFRAFQILHTLLMALHLPVNQIDSVSQMFNKY